MGTRNGGRDCFISVGHGSFTTVPNCQLERNTQVGWILLYANKLKQNYADAKNENKTRTAAASGLDFLWRNIKQGLLGLPSPGLGSGEWSEVDIHYPFFCQMENAPALPPGCSASPTTHPFPHHPGVLLWTPSFKGLLSAPWGADQFCLLSPRPSRWPRPTTAIHSGTWQAHTRSFNQI